HFDIILDIGSGSGNVTEILADRVKHRQIIGVDIDQKMIDFSIQNNTKPSIDFIAEDMSKPWDELSAGLRALEGKVSLVFSNSTLMMIQNKSTLVHNLHRLMAANSYAFISYVLTHDLNAKLSPKERSECEKWIKIPEYKQQVVNWTQVFTKQGHLSLECSQTGAQLIPRFTHVFGNKINRRFSIVLYREVNHFLVDVYAYDLPVFYPIGQYFGHISRTRTDVQYYIEMAISLLH
ncbi:unnamed protein product, partial [Medioppia subpectinata]